MKMTGAPTLHRAITISGLLEVAENEPIQLRIERDWWRSGAETYSLIFDVETQSAQRTAIMKACVAWGSLSLAATFEQWFTRRATLRAAGVQVPDLYCRDNATLVEEYIPFDFYEHVKQSPDRHSLLFAAGRAAALISKTGFTPLSLVDLRTRGSDVVFIDFGQDLGDPDANTRSGLLNLSEVISNLEHREINLSDAELRMLESGFAAVPEG
ncbi:MULTISPECIES: hypothetical protein [Nocardia]|nr:MULTISPECIES: hypothetical protein [Nocardia]